MRDIGNNILYNNKEEKSDSTIFGISKRSRLGLMTMVNMKPKNRLKEKSFALVMV